MTTTLVELSELMVSKAGSVDPKKFADEKFELFSIPAFDRGFSDLVLGSEIGSSKQVVRPGDLMLSKIVPHIRRAWIVPDSGDHRQIASGEWILFRSPRIYGPYLRHLLTSDFFNRQFMQTVAGVGGSLLRARPAHVAKIRVPLPLLDEQRRIAAILDTADELRTKRRRALAQLDVLTQSVFASVFGDIREWPKATFDELCGGDFRNGVSPSSRGLVQQRVLTLSAVTGEAFDVESNRVGMFDRPTPIEQRVASSSLLICRGNGNLNLVGRGHFPPSDCPDVVFPDTVIAAKPDFSRVTRAFLGHVWNSPEIRSQLEKRARTTNGTFKINQSMLGEILLPEPPMSRQNVFSEQVAVVHRLRAGHRTQLDELNALFGSVQHRAFTGEL